MFYWCLVFWTMFDHLVAEGHGVRPQSEVLIPRSYAAMRIGQLLGIDSNKLKV